jgi:dTDP-4-dehydrorhamnose 3,5-epimerase
MIDGVFIKPLGVFQDERGRVMHMLRADNPIFKQFGEVYFSVINPGFIKGWKKHLRITQYFAVPVGNIKLVLYDDRIDSATKGKIEELIIGEDNYQLVRIPPLVWYAFKSIDKNFALVTNCIDSLYDKNEIISLNFFDKKVPYNWEYDDNR